MRLADFIMREMDAILTEWDAFAGDQFPAAKHMDAKALRDHGQQILKAVAKDLMTPQSEAQQAEKSKGRAPRWFDAPETAAETHAVHRANSGFDISQLAGEYRALRACVLSLWSDTAEADALHLRDMIRFNEAIDQALAESITFFNDQVEHARNLLLGTVSHDMRSPLQAIRLTAEGLSQRDSSAGISDAAQLLIYSVGRMNALLDELVDFNRSNLGLGIPIVTNEVEVASVFTEEMTMLRAAYPDRRLELEVIGDTRGVWDGGRLRQLLGNLVINAITYGARDTSVYVAVFPQGPDLGFEVRNAGTAIKPASLNRIFDPLARGTEAHQGPARSHMGLGLYIARLIADAHGGGIEARSDAKETVFAVRLPRSPAFRNNGGSTPTAEH